MDGDGTWGHGGWLRVSALACNVRAPQRVDESRPGCDQAKQPPGRAGQQSSRAARRAWSRDGEDERARGATLVHRRPVAVAATD
jgi:hypothetical protein